MRCTEVVSVYNKKNKKDKNNYKLVHVLSNILKSFEICVQQQIIEYIDWVLSEFQCRFRRGFSAQHCLLVMLKKKKKKLQTIKEFLLQLSLTSPKFLTFLSCYLLITKLNASIKNICLLLLLISIKENKNLK